VHPVILPAPDLSIHTVLAPHLARFAGKMTVVAEAGSVELMKNLTLKLPAISFQTRLGLERELLARKLVHVPLQATGPVTTELGIYVRRGRTFPPTLDAFIALVLEQLSSLEKSARSRTS
jgi:DNA-binding transcriptional LysR family regulator